MNQRETLSSPSQLLCYAAVVLVVALALRLPFLNERPLHNDEGVNHFFIQQTLDKGYYPYSHENYHGPLYFYILTATERLFGDSETALRIPTVLIGALICLLPLFFLHSDPISLRLSMGLLLACSCTMLYYARYAIHESFFTFGSLVLALGALEWWRTGRRFYGYATLVALAFLITIKETWIVSFACAGFALLALCVRDVCLRSSSSSSSFSLKSIWTSLASLPQWQRLKHDFGHVILALIICSLAVVFVYTAGFRWSGGMREFFLAIPQWIGRNTSDVGHHKGFGYYAEIFEQADPLLLLQFPVALVEFFGIGLRKVYLEKDSGWDAVFSSGRHIFLLVLGALGMILTAFLFSWEKLKTFLRSETGASFLFLTVYGFAHFAVYSVLSYKTPWLIINITAPLLMVMAYFLFALAGRLSNSNISRQTLTYCFLLSACLLQIYASYEHAFRHSYGSGEPGEKEHALAYVHSSPGMRELAREILAYIEAHPQAKVLVAIEQYWPLPYYLHARKGNLSYLKTEEFDHYAKDHDVLIMRQDVFTDDPKFRVWTGRLSSVQETKTYFRNS